jgi:S-adenosylmethionine synthetase
MVDAAADGFGRLATATIKAKPDVGGTAALPGVQCDLWEGCLTLKDYIFTSESVSEGHPDKVCDQISDAILDAFIANDVKLGHADDSHANTRLGCETLATTNKIVIAGEGRASAPYMHKYGKHTIVNREALSEIARNVVRDIGYDQDGFSFHGADVEVLLHGQSPDIAMGVDAKKKGGNLGEQEGAGDQGLMFGFACRDSEEYEKGSFMPAPIYFSHKILEVLSKARRSGELPDLQPDAKSQVTVRYVDGKPVGCTKVVVSTQHNAQTRNGKKYTPGMVKELIGDAVEEALPEGWMPKKASDFLVNPTGNFVIGGPDGDCGLTGRKIIVDTYGGYAPHGGGAFSGKDPTKVDRSAAYAARYLAKNVVAAGLADSCTIQIAYAIGVADPMSVYVDTHGTGKVEEAKLQKLLPEVFPLQPTAIRRALKLNRPIYRRTAAYGHFGRAPEKDGGFSWERTDLADTLKRGLR